MAEQKAPFVIYGLNGEALTEQEYQALTGSAPMTAELRARLENRQQGELDAVKGKQPKSGARKLEAPKPDAKKAAQTGREEMLATIREAGIEIADDATDAEISAALAEMPE